MSLTIEELHQSLELIKSRNQKVELDKPWETSLTRKISVSLLTYIVISIFFIFIGVKESFVNAIVPTLGFLLSTLTLKSIKKVWIAKQNLTKF